MESPKLAKSKSHMDMEDEKMEEFDGYKEYRNKINLDKLVQFACNFDPIKIALDDIYEKLYNNQESINNLSRENQDMRMNISSMKDQIYHHDERLVIIKAKIGDIDPSCYQFPDIYEEIFKFLKKLNEIEKEVRDLSEAQHDDDTIKYMKGIISEKLADFHNKIKDIEVNINAFISLYEFRNSQDYRPESITSSESQRGAKKAQISSIDPLIGKIPETHEEEKQCLVNKLKEAKQRMHSIESNLRDEDEPEEKIDYEKRINEVLDFCKINKKRIEEVLNISNQNDTNTKSTLNKNIRDEIDKMKEFLSKRLKEIPKNQGGADEGMVKQLKSDIAGLTDKHRSLLDKLQKLEKLVNEHDEELNRVIKACDSKANRPEFLSLDNKVKDIDTTVESLRDYINNLKIPKQTDNSGDQAKQQELERMLLALEGKLDRTQDTLNERMNEINKFMDMIKEDIDKQLEEQEKQNLKTMSRCNVCEVRIDTLEKQMKNTNPKSGISLPDVDGKEALKGLKQLEAKFQKMKEDLSKRLQAIEYNDLPKKASKEDLEELESKIYDKIKALEREILKLRSEVQVLSKSQELMQKEIKKQRKRETSNDRDEASLIKRPLMGFKCANCERDLNNLEGTQAEFFNWKKLPRSIKSKKNNKINMNLHNIGHGFSKMLQTFSTDNLHTKDLMRPNDISSNTIDIGGQEDQDAEYIKYPNREFLSDNEEEIRKISKEPPATSRLLPHITRK